MDKNLITLHNIYRRQVLKELKEVKAQGVTWHQYEGLLELSGLTCKVCKEKWIPHKSRVAVDNDHWSSAAYSTFCTQCVADTLGWQAEKQFMNARWRKDDRVLLTQKGAEALASAPEYSNPLQYID